jgi:hypothetical protein
MATFGDSTVYGTATPGGTNRTLGCRYACPEKGLATLISWYLSADAGKPNTMKAGLYNADGSLAGETNSLAVEAAGWYNFTANILLTAQNYDIAIIGDGSSNTWYWYRTGIYDATRSVSRDDTGTAPTFPNPATWTLIYLQKNSVYVTYTPGDFSVSEVPKFRGWKDWWYRSQATKLPAKLPSWNSRFPKIIPKHF